MIVRLGGSDLTKRDRIVSLEKERMKRPLPGFGLVSPTDSIDERGHDVVWQPQDVVVQVSRGMLSTCSCRLE